MVDFPHILGGHSGSPRVFPGAQPPKSLKPEEIADLFADLAKLKRRSDTATALVTALRVKITDYVGAMRKAQNVCKSAASFIVAAKIEGGEAEEQRVALVEMAELLEHMALAKDVYTLEANPLPGIEKGSGDEGAK